MHVIFRESHGLEETDTPQDLGQDPADLVVLSFSDSDLAAFAAGWALGGGREGDMPSLRLANLKALKHPLSVDTYMEQTLSGARAVLIRLIGGVPYWEYGLMQLRDLAARKGITVAVLPADGRADPRLGEFSTLPEDDLARLKKLVETGGGPAGLEALQLICTRAGLGFVPKDMSTDLPGQGIWKDTAGGTPIAVVFYRSYLVSDDMAPIRAICDRLTTKGYGVRAFYVPSLKAPAAAKWLREALQDYSPKAIINATAFSGRGADGTSPLDGVPVFQTVLATSDRAAWDGSERGLSPTDLAMHVVLPEVDGRLMGHVISFKEQGARDPDLQFARVMHTPDLERIDALIARVDGWLKPHQRLALLLSTYPGKDWNMGHAVGLDAPASARAIVEDLRADGYDLPELGEGFEADLLTQTLSWPRAAYEAALAKLPAELTAKLHKAWGALEDDPSYDAQGAQFHFRAIQLGESLVALQPERGHIKTRDDDYHDLARTPRHGYVAFYLWLQTQVDAVIHIGAHGTLEWLPGKSVALSNACWPEALICALPVIYPFIVNDPGEAAQAKRRIGAMTLGHVPPPLKQSTTPDRLARLENLLDEFSNADGLDPKRRDRLQADIRDEAQALGVEDDLGLTKASCTAEAITRIDRFVCDIKESQFGDGLHIWGRAPKDAPNGFAEAASSERSALIRALHGHAIASGPSGSPYRGRNDVLPTGRNLYTTDPRSVPTRAAYAQGVKLAEELIRATLQDQGDWPKGVVVDLWGSATMRTAGEDFAMALHLIGAKPKWDEGSERVSGIEIIPLTELNRPRIETTLRVSGMFRDVFPTLATLFNQAIDALEHRDEASDFNPFVRTKNAHVFGPAPGSYGIGMGEIDMSEESKKAAGESWLKASSWAITLEGTQRDEEGITQAVKASDTFAHAQDLPETDLLMARDYATHEAGFSAAKEITGGETAALFHLDNTDPNAPRARALSEEIARVVQARAANPDWIKGMRRHGFQGAAQIAATLDNMAAFARLANVVSPQMFDLYYEATLGDRETTDFMSETNPEALAAMRQLFSELMAANLWQTKRNSIRAELCS